MIQQRNIAVAVILSIVTGGIYGLYWLFKLNEESKYLAEQPEATSGGLVIVLSIVTCGIYTYYWHYTMGKRMAIAQEKSNTASEDRSLVYLILAILGLGIVNYCLIQNDINIIVGNGPYDGDSYNNFAQ